MGRSQYRVNQQDNVNFITFITNDLKFYKEILSEFENFSQK